MDFRLFLLRHVPLLRVLFRWTIRLLLPRKLVKARLAYLHAAASSWRASAPFGSGDVGVAVPRTEAARRTGRRACCTTLPQHLQRLPHVAVSSSLPTVVGRSPEHALDGRFALSWPTPSTAITARVECVELSRQYLHLSPLVDVA